ncbi:MAG TPA: bifunctional transaldolase/phosoglucose isomerase [Anaerolineales bacterium]|nr:bifunctional transaldolase/phosoglucose isomerase [Anaerolineales bacterium]
MTLPISQLYSLGQSLWYDNIQRRLLENGELAAMIRRGDIRGVTSNPTIFNNAIAKTNDYDMALVPLAWSGWDAEKIFWQLAIEDIRDACDLFTALYRETEGADGYVSLEVNPTLAHNTAGTLAQAKQLWEWVNRPNLMVKIPATPEGIPAIRAAIAAGINVNVTLIFSLERYRAVMDAYLDGLNDRLLADLPVQGIASVASFFVSRMDTKVDAALESLGTPEAKGLLGKAAIAYTKLAYDEFLKIFRGERFSRFQAAGCRVQRPLWASTSTKNPAYPDTMYVDELIGPGTVNTVPPQTLTAFRDHGKAVVTILSDLDGARKSLAELESLGISMDKVTAELESEGVKSFSDSFAAMLKTIDERRLTAVSALGPLAAPVSRRVAALVEKDAPARLWSHDPSLWTADPDGQAEVRKRLGWLDLPRTSRAALKEINDFTAQVKKDGFTHVLLLGMGGSSLAPEVLSLVFACPGITFAILDSTDPGQVAETAARFPTDKTLFLVSSKSGGTAEINAMFNYFWEQTGGDGRHFAAITDPGTGLEALANARGFRATFHADPTVGGRFSALSHFGLVPAGLIGIDLERLLDRAAWMMRQCAADVSGARNPGLVLGAILGQAAVDGRDKLTFLADESVAPLGAWLEQLIAESTGKQGKGIVVVDGEPVAGPESYGADRLFVYLRREGKLDPAAAVLNQAGHPLLVFNLPDAYDIGAEFYRWQVATAFACAALGINAFDQPDVQDAKTRTVNKIAAYGQSGKLDEGQPVWEKDGVKAYSDLKLGGPGLKESLTAFVKSAKKGDYVAINAYVPRNAANAAELGRLRLALRTKTGCATTLGFGPRFLHSTGQLHKGGPDSGLFLEITAEPVKDLPIPTQKMDFGVLERAQSLGDYEALEARKRRILRLHLASPDDLEKLVKALQ